MEALLAARTGAFLRSSRQAEVQVEGSLTRPRRTDLDGPFARRGARRRVMSRLRLAAPSRSAKVGCSASEFKADAVPSDALGDRSPRVGATMPNDLTEPPPMRMGDCPYCERAVLVYEEPP